MYQGLTTRHDWPINNSIVDLPIKMKGNSKRCSFNSLSPSGAQNMDIGSSSQTLFIRQETIVWSSTGSELNGNTCSFSEYDTLNLINVSLKSSNKSVVIKNAAGAGTGTGTTLDISMRQKPYTINCSNARQLIIALSSCRSLARASDYPVGKK